MNTDAPAEATSEPPARTKRLPAIGVGLLALVAYVPLLFTAPGEVGADTKTYLYLDPGRLLSRAAWMWDTNIGLGTVTHQNIGYLWPMGPWYWFWEAVGLPDWVAQRLWLGTVIFAAGMGVRFMLRELRWQGPGLTVAAFAYALSPYLLHYGARISVILLPFAGLPWLIGLASRSARKGGWRWPAVFALVTLTVGGVNATSLLLVMAAPVLWFVHAVWVTREVPIRRALGAGLRISALTLVTSLWWLAGLAVQGSFGIPILRYTETYATVANAALSTELFRGLGYWFFYGRDALGAWIAPAERMVQSIPALFLSFTVPGLALVSGFFSRFANRGYFALLVATGLVIGVGAHPWDASTPAGGLFQAWTRTDSGLAFRSTPRAIPLIALGLAVMLAAAVAGISARRPGWHLPVAGVLLAMILLNQWALLGGEMVDRNLKRDEDLPQYSLDAAAAMDSASTGSDEGPAANENGATRVYELPGSDFASYRWGNTVDPVTPGLIDRPYAARELIPYGTPASADLLNAWDLPLQEGSSDPAAIVPIAQLLGVGTIAHRADLQYERFRTPRPDVAYHELLSAEGLSDPESFGVDVDSTAAEELPLDDEVALGVPPDWAAAPAVSLFDLEDPRDIARTVSASSPTLLAGDGAGIVAWARTDGLDPDRPILYSASYADDPEALEQQLTVRDAQLVVTDTNRRQARRWGSVRENDGYTEREGEEPLAVDPADNRLDKFPGAGDDSYTVTEQLGGATVGASSYGNPVSYTPSDRAVHAMDGDSSTAWRVGAFDEVRGEFLEIDLDEPVTASTLDLQQTQRQGNRWITEVELSFDGGDPAVVQLDEASRGSAPGQAVSFEETTFERLRITITEANVGELDRYVGVSDVGIAEVVIPGVDPVVEVVRPPTDLLDAAGQDSLEHPLTYVFTRRAANPAEVVVDSEERLIRRWVDAPTDREYSVFGTARASTELDDHVVDALLGVGGVDDGGVSATATSQLAGDLRSRATSAIDGDPDTAWQTPINSSVGQQVTVESATPFEFDGMELTLRRDGLHSVPTQLTVSVDGGPDEFVAVPAIGIGERDGATDVDTVQIPLPARQASTVRIGIEALDEAESLDWFGGSRTVLPVGVVELGLGVRASVPADTEALPAACRDDLLTLDGVAVPARVDGTVGQALDGAPLDVAGCTPVALAAGRSLLETAPGTSVGFDLDQVVLGSAAGGVPGTDTLLEGPEPVDPPPGTAVTNPSRLGWEFEVSDATEPYWVVLGQSFSPGFEATAGDGTDLGEPTLVNGYANGWLVDPAEVGADTTISVSWTPQRLVWIALALSALGVLACLALLVWPLRLWAGSPLSRRASAMRPRFVPVLSSQGSALALPRAAAAAIGVGLITWLLAGWPAALVVAAATLLALAVPKGQPVLRIAGIALFAAAAGYVVLKQWRVDYLVDFNWMNQFEVTHAWTLAAVALLVVDPVVAHLRGPGHPHHRDPQARDPQAQDPQERDPAAG